MNPSQPINLLFLAWTAGLGGAEIALLRLLSHLDRTRFKPQVWLFQSGILQNKLEELHIPTRVWPARRFSLLMSNPVFHAALAQHLIQQKIDLVHGVGTLAYLAGYVPARITRRKILWWLVDLPSGKDPAERVAGQIPATLIACNSNATAEAFRKTYPGNASRRKVIYPSIKMPSISEGSFLEAQKKKLREDLNLPSDAALVLAAARFQKWKGLEVLVQSIPKILKAAPQTFFLFAGAALPGMDDGTGERLQQLSQDLKIQDHCRFLGFRSDVELLMETSDLVVHTSIQPEPFGLVVAEAMAHQKAVIATHLGGPKEMIDHSQDGWLVPPNDPERLSQAILYLLQNPELRSELGHRAHEKSIQKCHPQTIARQMEEIYLDLLKPR